MKLIHEYSTIHPSDFLYLECRPIDFILFLFQRKTTKTVKKCMFAIAVGCSQSAAATISYTKEHGVLGDLVEYAVCHNESR